MAEGERVDKPGNIVERARAKINLTLSVVGRRADGYHELRSLVVFADVGDTVTLQLGSSPNVSVAGPFGADITGRNLVAEALAKLGQREPRLQLGSVEIEKNLPVAAGLGGGSADAAALLRAIRRANPENADTFDWIGFAAELGSDVPVCFVNRPSLMWGRGEKVLPLTSLPSLAAVLANPGVPVPADKTTQVFRRLSAPPIPETLPDPEPPPSITRAEDAIAYARAHTNDLAEPARDVIPACREVEAALASCDGCQLARISGAGPTCFGLFLSTEAAQAAAQQLSRSHPNWWVRSVTLG